MYTELPHDIIRRSIEFALHHATTHNRKARRRNITMERTKGGHIMFGKTKSDPYDKTSLTLSFAQILEISIFDVENAYFQSLNTTLKQIIGIPMGSPGSPSYAICVCMYYEHQFHASMHDYNIITRTNPTTTYFRAQRYIDDLFAIFPYDKTDTTSFIHAKIRKHILSIAYHHNMKLKEELTTSKFTFLEGTLNQISDTKIQVQHNNKNYTHLRKTGNLKFLTTKHADSFMSNSDKTNNFLGALHRIRDASESRKQAILDTVKMIHVYDHLGYELRHYISALTKIYKKTQEPHWRRLRRAISK